MANFEWQNEENDSFWQESPKPPEQKNQAWIGWAMLLLFLCGLGVGGWWLYRKMTNQVDEISKQTDQEVRASFKLLYEVADKKDGDLFNTLLSGRDQGWTAIQQQMMMTDGLLNRSVLGFDLASPYPQISKLSLSPTLLSAEITAIVSYTVFVGNDIHEIVQLELPVIYRKGDTRWLYAPPEPDFWGETAQISQGKITASAPTRDLKLATELTSDLSDTMDKFYQDDPDFPYWSQIELEFTTDPQIMLNWSRYPTSLEALARPKLPTPSLVGIPTNKAGYQMLLNSYAEQLFTPYLAHIAGYPSNVFDKDFFFQNVLEYQWVKLGLRASPLSQQHYKALWETLTSSSSYEVSVQSMMLSSNSVIAFDLPYALVEFALDGGTGQPISFSEALLLDMSTLVSWTNRSEFYQFLAEKGGLPILEQTPTPLGFENDLFSPHILEYQQVKLGVRPSPVSQEEYELLWQTLTSSSSPYEASVVSMMISAVPLISSKLPYALVEFALEGGTGQSVSSSNPELLDLSTLASWTARSEFHQFLAEKGDLPILEQTPTP